VYNFEPRVDNLDVEVIGRPDRNELEVKVLFEIVGLEVPTQSFSFILEPTR
jgi:predicted component of type VI protein secretion system